MRYLAQRALLSALRRVALRMRGVLQRSSPDVFCMVAHASEEHVFKSHMLLQWAVRVR